MFLSAGWRGASKSTMKGLMLSGSSTGGRRRFLEGYIPLEGPSAGFWAVLMYLVTRIVLWFSSSL